ncbi:hypothetical protein [uncultured Duncaniella sp.]|uniref:hypothetical protein n=1 Tax=uncultured Duncaniella sp. TaxID=2768039 RepID=UPI0025FB7826|nr:hypothetical protein [uncultured Duncaniella sp.]
MKKIIFLFCFLQSIMSVAAQSRYSTKTEFVAGYYVLDNNRLIRMLEHNVNGYAKTMIKGKNRDAFMEAYSIAVKQIAKGTVRRDLRRVLNDSSGTLKNTPGKFDAMGYVATFIDGAIDYMIKNGDYIEFSTE